MAYTLCGYQPNLQTFYIMRKISKKQAKLNREVDRIKRNLSPYCCICGRESVDPAHLLPRSTYPEYYTEEWNIVPMCREHHNLYDGNLEFRKTCTDLIEIVRQHDEQAANRHFKL